MKKLEFISEAMSTIPIMIDDIKQYKGFDMTRCTYFSIESDIPAGEWILRLKDLEIPFYLIGLSGIITEPIGDKAEFDSPHLIDEIFKTIEESPELFVDINDIWLPNFMFKDFPHARGSVFRSKERLFAEAIRFREDKIPTERFEKSCRELKDDLSYSEKETQPFKDWAKKQIDMAKKTYPKNPELALKWREVKK